MAGIAASAILHFWRPEQSRILVFCVFRRITGQACPGCGLTRAFAHLARFEWTAALSLHPLAPVLALELLLGWSLWGLCLTGRLPAVSDRWIAATALAHAAALLGIWLVRLGMGSLPV